MKDIKKTLKLAGIMALIVNVLNITNLLFNIFAEKFYVFPVVEEGICIILTFITSITYLCFLKKTKEQIIQKKGLFLALSLINIFNNIFVWIISLWVEIAVSNLARISYMKKMFTNPNTQENGNEIHLSEDDYEIKKETENLTEALKDLENLKSKNLITEDEYNELRQKLINKFLNKE